MLWTIHLSPEAVPSGSSCSESPQHTVRYYFPLTTSAHRGQSVSDDSAVYFQQRGHFSLVVRMTITLYEDSSRISPPMKEKHVRSIFDRPLNLYNSLFFNWLAGASSKLPPSCLGKYCLICIFVHKQPRPWTHTTWLTGERRGIWDPERLIFPQVTEFCIYSGRAGLLALHLGTVVINYTASPATYWIKNFKKSQIRLTVAVSPH